LLIDDKPENLMALKSILDLPDREIISCLSGSEALQILLKKKVSLILVDVQMPDMVTSLLRLLRVQILSLFPLFLSLQ
jgi:CheY-like chemotaxis protein